MRENYVFQLINKLVVFRTDFALSDAVNVLKS